MGVLATVAAYGVGHYVASAKSAEARIVIGQIGKSADRELGEVNLLTLGANSTTSQRRLCTGSTAVPDALAKVQNKKYQSFQTEWDGDAFGGWRCLRFSMIQPQYYQYEYTATPANDVSEGAFTALATGDLNGDGVTSTFSLAGAVTSGHARFAPSIQETSPEE